MFYMKCCFLLLTPLFSLHRSLPVFHFLKLAYLLASSFCSAVSICLLLSLLLQSCLLFPSCFCLVARTFQVVLHFDWNIRLRTLPFSEDFVQSNNRSHLPYLLPFLIPACILQLLPYFKNSPFSQTTITKVGFWDLDPVQRNQSEFGSCPFYLHHLSQLVCIIPVKTTLPYSMRTTWNHHSFLVSTLMRNNTRFLTT